MANFEHGEHGTDHLIDPEETLASTDQVVAVKEVFRQKFVPLIGGMRCSRQYQDRIRQIMESTAPRNDLFEKFIRPNLFLPELNQFTPVHVNKKGDYSHLVAVAAIEALEDNPAEQAYLSFFSNGLGIPEYGPSYSTYSGKYEKTWEKPSLRAIVPEFWFFTLEYDSDDQNAFEQQLDWVWRKDSKDQTKLKMIDNELRKKFRDYRGYSVVWSGGKSLHLNFVFCTSHLSHEMITHIAGRDGKNPDHMLKSWHGDIRQDAIWPYYTSKWTELVALAKTIGNISVEFDSSMSLLHQKRRLPWGLREIDSDNIHGFPAGSEIPQIVLEENLIMSSPRGAADFFLRADEANALPPRSRSKTRTNNWKEVHHPEILVALTKYLERHWGKAFPTPAKIVENGDEIAVYFFNHPGDQHPSTFVQETYSGLIYRGKSAPSDDPKLATLPGGITLGDLVSLIIDDLGCGEEPGGDQSISLRRYPTPPERHFARRAKERTHDGVRAGLNAGIITATAMAPHVIVSSPEGAGKSSMILSSAVGYRKEDYIERYFTVKNLVAPENGFQLFAARAYEQLEEQFDNYRARSGGVANALLIRSFSEYYRAYTENPENNPPETIKPEMALEMGYNTLVDAVYAVQRSVYDAISLQRDLDWTLPDGTSGFHNRFDLILFCTHALAQEFNQVSKSKAWLHPGFDPEMDHEEWNRLASEFTVYRLIHDEVSWEDLLLVATEAEVKFAHDVRKSVKDWSCTQVTDRYSAYSALSGTAPKWMNFYRCCELVEADFVPSDAVHVDYDQIPFGVENSDSSIYKAQDGQPRYIRLKNWWSRLRARVVITTTEKLPKIIASQARWTSGDCPGESKFYVLNANGDEFFPTEQLLLVPDARASKDRVQELVNCILEDTRMPTDFVITNSVKHDRVINHIRARGRNDLSHVNLASILTFIGPDQYSNLNVIGQFFNIPDVIPVYYRDVLNQDVGRNRGFRSSSPTPKDHRVYVSPRLLRSLGGIGFFRQGRYRFSLGV